MSTSSRVAGICALIACPVALTSFGLLPTAFGGDFDAVFDPARAIAFDGVKAGYIRWAWFLDIVGYYFLLLPAVLVLAERYRDRSALASGLGERAAFGYMVSGSCGAAILAGSTDLFARWQVADEAGRTAVAEVYLAIFHLVDKGLWNTLCMSLLSVWLLLVGRLLASDRPLLGFAMLALGVCSVLDVAGGLLGLEGVAMAGLFGYLIGFPLWSAALGVHLIRAR